MTDWAISLQMCFGYKTCFDPFFKSVHEDCLWHKVTASKSFRGCNGVFSDPTFVSSAYCGHVWQWRPAEFEINFCYAFACVSRWPGDLADADLPPHSASPPGGLWSSDVSATFRDQHGHVSVNVGQLLAQLSSTNTSWLLLAHYRSEARIRIGVQHKHRGCVWLTSGLLICTMWTKTRWSLLSFVQTIDQTKDSVLLHHSVIEREKCVLHLYQPQG